MIQINLLPWRDADRQKRNQKFICQLLMVALAGVVLMLLLRGFFTYQINQQTEKNTQIIRQNQALANSLANIQSVEQHQVMLMKMTELAQYLQTEQNLPAQLWQTLATSILSDSHELRLTQLKREEAVLLIIGQAQHANSVANFAKKLNASPLLNKVSIRSTQQEKVVTTEATLANIRFELVASIIPAGGAE